MKITRYAPAFPTRLDEVKAECQRRIFEVVDSHAQMNMSAHRGDGRFDAGELAIYQAGLDWIGAMRSNCLVLAGNSDDLYADTSWPVVPTGLPELAANF